FRSSPLRNAKLQPSFFHNGSFKDLKKAIKYHLDPKKNIKTYSPSSNEVPDDLKYRAFDMPNVMATLDPALRNGIRLSEKEIDDLYNFVRDGLYDDNASPEKMRKLIPKRVPSGVKVAFFEDNESNDIRPSDFVNSSSAKGIGEKEEIGEAFSARLLSNPTHNGFTIVLFRGDVGVKTKMIITDINGRMVETRNLINEGQTINFGQNYQKGVFVAELTQGQKKITFKLIKM
ncbi:MAG: T9SS type A sorting domain-containing protein, partial [Flavisolibacter sp.]